MTQILGAITPDYVLLASDRRLADAKSGKMFDDDTCKLVCLCNTCGIAYTGLANFEGAPTHEWIAKSLASENCRDSLSASQVLKTRAQTALSALKLPVKIPQEFLMLGWGLFKELDGLHPFMRLVTNLKDASGKPLSEPGTSFTSFLKVLVAGQSYFLWTIGQPIQKSRGELLERNLRRLVSREIGPAAALRLLVDEIVHTSVAERNPFVGSKVLALCVPKASVQRQIDGGPAALLATLPDTQTAAFTYFEPGYNELRQYGPTYVCGESAVTDLQTEKDDARKYQSSQVRILSWPKSTK